MHTYVILFSPLGHVLKSWMQKVCKREIGFFWFTLPQSYSTGLLHSKSYVLTWDMNSEKRIGKNGIKRRLYFQMFMTFEWKLAHRSHASQNDLNKQWTNVPYKNSYHTSTMFHESLKLLICSVLYRARQLQYTGLEAFTCDMITFWW